VRWSAYANTYTDFRGASGAGNRISRPAVCFGQLGPLAREVPSFVVFFGLVLVLIGLVYQFLFLVCSIF
jgi:hypothetical protein